MKKAALILFCLVMSAISFHAPLAYGGGWRDFEATGVEYHSALDPRVNTSRFESKIKFFREGSVKVVEIQNFVKGGKKPDIYIKVAVSSGSAGAVVYDSEMKVIAEYLAGVAVDENLLTFVREEEDSTVNGRWFLDQDALLSDFAILDPAGVAVFQETVIYRAKKPLRKK